MATFTFYGAERIIQIEDVGDHDFTAQEVYSRWKEWVQTDDNSKYETAFRSVAGDPISETQSISPYVFLNTVAGWRFRCHDGDHEMHITGNLYSEDPDLSMFVPTLDNSTVTITIDRSASAITTFVSGGGGGGVDEQVVRDAMTAQGYTSARAPKLDQLDVAVSSRATSGQGLTVGQSNALAGIDSRVDVAVSTRAAPGQGLTSGQATGLATIEARVDVATSSRAASGEAEAALAAAGVDAARMAKVDRLDVEVSTRAEPGEGLSAPQDEALARVDGRVDVQVSSRAIAGQGLTSGQDEALARLDGRVDVAVSSRSPAGEATAAVADAGVTPTRMARLDANVSSRAVQGEGLTSNEKAMLLDIFRLLGLDPTKPLVHDIDGQGNGTRRAPADGSAIDQEFVASGNVVTVTRR